SARTSGNGFDMLAPIRRMIGKCTLSWKELRPFARDSTVCTPAAAAVAAEAAAGSRAMSLERCWSRGGRTVPRFPGTGAVLLPPGAPRLQRGVVLRRLLLPFGRGASLVEAGQPLEGGRGETADVRRIGFQQADEFGNECDRRHVCQDPHGGGPPGNVLLCL